MVTVGITVIVLEIGIVPLFVAVKGRIFPFPDADNPIAELLFVQSKVVPGIVPLNITSLVEYVLHKLSELIGATLGPDITTNSAKFEVATLQPLPLKLMPTTKLKVPGMEIAGGV